tara:strand:- start:47899 stop:48309 length:411 start_codon:yes stop_codon:yes gene_type:complete
MLGLVAARWKMSHALLSHTGSMPGMWRASPAILAQQHGADQHQQKNTEKRLAQNGCCCAKATKSKYRSGGCHDEKRDCPVKQGVPPEVCGATGLATHTLDRAGQGGFLYVEVDSRLLLHVHVLSSVIESKSAVEVQ